MRILKFIFPATLAFGSLSLAAAEKDPPAAGEKPADQQGSISGTLHPPSNNAPSGAIAEMQVGGSGKADGVTYFLFAEGSLSRKLKDLASKSANATVSGVITEKGYRVTSIDKK